ncbi:MAG: hypothetical protein WB239_06340 [Acidimicrobiia bacterium]
MKTWVAVASATMLLLVFHPVALAHSGGFSLIGFLFTVLGAVMEVRLPGHRFGRFMLVAGAGMLVNGLAFIPMFPPPATLTPIVFVAVYVATFWPIPIGLLIHLFYVFPTGQLPSGRWKVVRYLEGAVVALWGLMIFFSPTISPPNDEWQLANPLAIGSGTSPVGGILIGVVGIGMLGLAAGGFAAILTRWRRASWSEKNQIKLVLYGGTLFLAAFILQSFLSESGTVLGALANVAFVATAAAIPVLMTLAIIRHGLFDVDRLISRTVGYSIVVIVLGLIYVVGAVYLPVRIIGTSTPPVFVAGTTLLLALIFNPLRRRIQRRVDRRFYRSRYDTEREVEAVSARLQGQLDLAQVSGIWVGMVSRLMRPESLRLWLPPFDGDPAEPPPP